MADPLTKRREWTRPSGTVMSDCPKCVEAGKLVVTPLGRFGDAACDVCEGKGEIGLATAVAWILAHGKTDPAPPGEEHHPADEEEDTKPER